MRLCLQVDNKRIRKLFVSNELRVNKLLSLEQNNEVWFPSSVTSASLNKKRSLRIKDNIIGINAKQGFRLFVQNQSDQSL